VIIHTKVYSSIAFRSQLEVAIRTGETDRQTGRQTIRNQPSEVTSE